jgi:hypothetical protein
VKRTDLDALLAAARAADADLEASPRVEARLRASYRELHQPLSPVESPRGIGLRAARDWFWAGLAAAVAAAALVAVTRPPRAPSAPAVAEVDAETEDFTPLLYGDPWADVDAVQVVRVEMPRSALAALGYVHAPPPSEAAAAVRADLLVGNDGIARGIRFVR